MIKKILSVTLANNEVLPDKEMQTNKIIGVIILIY